MATKILNLFTNKSSSSPNKNNSSNNTPTKTNNNSNTPSSPSSPIPSENTTTIIESNPPNSETITIVENIDVVEPQPPPPLATPKTGIRKPGGLNFMVDELKGKLSNRKTTSFSPKEVETALSSPSGTQEEPIKSTSLSSSSSSSVPPPQPSSFVTAKISSKPAPAARNPLNRSQSQSTSQDTPLSYNPFQPLQPKQTPPPPTPVERQQQQQAQQQQQQQPPQPQPPQQQSQPQPPSQTSSLNSSSNSIQKEMSPNPKGKDQNASGEGAGSRITSLFKKPLKKITAITGLTQGSDSHDKHAGKPRAQVLYDFDTDQQGELALKTGEIIVINQKDPSGWWQGTNPNTGAQGWFSNTFVEELPQSSTSSTMSPSKESSKDNKSSSKPSAPPPSSSSGPQYGTVELKLQAIKPETPKLEHKRKPGAARGRKLPSRARASYLLDPNERAERDKLRAGFYSVSPLRKEDFPDEDDDSYEDSSSNGGSSLNTSVGNSSPTLTGSRSFITSSAGNTIEQEEEVAVVSSTPTPTSPPIAAADKPKPPPPKRNIAPLQLSSDNVPPETQTTESTENSNNTSTTSPLSSSSGTISPPPPQPAKVMKLKPKPSAPPRNPEMKLSSDTTVTSPTPSSPPPPLANVEEEKEKEKEKEKEVVAEKTSSSVAAPPPQNQPKPPAPGMVKLKPMVKVAAKPPPAAAGSQPPTPGEPSDAPKKILVPLKRTTTFDGDSMTPKNEDKPSEPIKPLLKPVVKPRVEGDSGGSTVAAAPAQAASAPPPMKPKVAPRKEPSSPPTTSAGASASAPAPQHNRVPSSSSSNPTTPVTSSPPAASPVSSSPPQNSASGPPPPALKKISPTVPRRALTTSSEEQASGTPADKAPTGGEKESKESLYNRITSILPDICKQVESMSTPLSTFQHQLPPLSQSFFSARAYSVLGSDKDFSYGSQERPRIPLFQSVWPFIFTLLCEDLGSDEIDKSIGSNLPENDTIPYNENKKAHNPFCTGGALVESNLYSSKYPSPAYRISQVLSTIDKIIKGGVSCDMGSYLSQKNETSDEVATAHLLKSVGLLKSPEDILDFYYQLNSIHLDVSQISQLTTTLASLGISPINQSKFANQSNVKKCLEVLKNCDTIMNELDGNQCNNGVEMITLGSKSGVLMVIIPQVMGITLCTHGNNDRNEKHIQFCKLLKQQINSL
ncbi:SH3 domain-containing protein [Cavenderia fasciculata]|uniref:glutaminase n=1 Tax=Cavenderia fasciculata TaxID=261658 RepID=F4PLX6_CACFS|nr:SH3 domain-containing protein [Cavenderia fasciculata]EGG23530.1 SH3 domain-containing protein [Cavenderia fasciculata]|eukprot:XP_004361381.1 SH3 domain-containing protein [Cavenderia fasciculata]